MDISTIKTIATKGLGRGLLLSKKHSPAILTTVGVVGVVTSAVLASKATLRLEETVEDIQEHLEVARERSDGDTDKHTKEIAYIYARGTLKITKLYGPSVSLGIASIACLIGAQGIMHKRNVALAAAYKAVEQGFSEYRKRVVEDLGVDKDREYRYGPLVTEDIQDEKTGEVVTIKRFDPNGVSVYAKFFDEYSAQWSKTPEYNLIFVRCQQNYANDLLKARGHLFLNEVYDMLGIERTSAGSVVGWVMSEDGDNFVDFGIYDFGSEKSREFVNGQERSILLDFNVDGVIYDRI